MGVKNAVTDRIKYLCDEKKIKVNAVANQAGITASTLYSILDESRKDIGIIAIKQICDGLGITLGEFFNTKEFDELEQEIK